MWRKGFIRFGWVLWLLGACGSAWASNVINGVRVWISPQEKARVVLDLKDPPQYSSFLLKKPARLVIDLPDTKMKVDLNKLKYERNWIKTIRSSKPATKGGYRLVIELKQSLKPIIFPLNAVGPYGDRLVIDLPLPEQPSKPSVSQPITHNSQQLKPIVIVIDAGHGGEDPGSIGPRRVYEKNLTLAVARKLYTLINHQYGFKAVMTRTGDYYVDLNRRSVIARKNKASVLISIHADSFSSSKPQGASVWVLSTRRANREMGRWLEKQEQLSELLGGVGKVIDKTDPNPYLTRTFVDLSMNRSRTEGYAVSLDVLHELHKVVKLHKTKPQHASLAVLKSPDIPSLLVEMGFISNPAEERKLVSRAYQQKLAQAIFDGLKDYYIQHAPKNTLFAKRYKVERYVVKRGDNLSKVAKRYAVSIEVIRERNKLRSLELKIGQVLMIPRT